ncbi:unnamed protein product [Callosobruchus maculatus]|uniref:CUB domain-containing protein n=1 Tax=Callosobruchus maculatus TaxID=64391 RepID=A0A653BRE8_CALMS|nr:unnamed protein product [Callosobruchus maculatus]
MCFRHWRLLYHPKNMWRHIQLEQYLLLKCKFSNSCNGKHKMCDDNSEMQSRYMSAPSGCLQFFNSTSGTVNSFNFGTGGNSIDPNTGLPGTRQLVNENYGVCVHMLPGYCSIQWSSNNFVVSGAPQANFGALTNGDCTTDFVVIPNPSYVNGTPVNSDRFCGTAFNTVTSKFSL